MRVSIARRAATRPSGEAGTSGVESPAFSAVLGRLSRGPASSASTIMATPAAIAADPPRPKRRKESLFIPRRRFRGQRKQSFWYWEGHAPFPALFKSGCGVGGHPRKMSRPAAQEQKQHDG